MMTDNEIIAEFMEIRHEPDACLKSKDLYWHYDQLNVMSDKLYFDTSWDWLMPVVEKIESLGYCHWLSLNRLDNNFYSQFLNENNEVEAYSFCAPIKIVSVYNSVVEFIKWYNQQK